MKREFRGSQVNLWIILARWLNVVYVSVCDPCDRLSQAVLIYLPRVYRTLGVSLDRATTALWRCWFMCETLSPHTDVEFIIKLYNFCHLHTMTSGLCRLWYGSVCVVCHSLVVAESRLSHNVTSHYTYHDMMCSPYIHSPFVRHHWEVILYWW